MRVKDGKVIMDDVLGQTGQWTAPGPGEIAAAAAKYGTIPDECHKCGGIVISGVCIITIWGGLICPICLRKCDEERECSSKSTG